MQLSVEHIADLRIIYTSKEASIVTYPYLVKVVKCLYYRFRSISIPMRSLGPDLWPWCFCFVLLVLSLHVFVIYNRPSLNQSLMFYLVKLAVVATPVGLTSSVDLDKSLLWIRRVPGIGRCLHHHHEPTVWKQCYVAWTILLVQGGWQHRVG